MLAVNTIWVLLAATLVFFMQAGFAMLEAGFTRAKNAGNIIMKNILDLSIGSAIFWFVGFGIMFGTSNPFFGGFDFFIKGNYSEILPNGVPVWAFVILQTVFCATAATIVSGAMAERTKFSAYIVYCIAICLIVYPITGHWAWAANGFLANLGYHDFAGSSVVHMVGGVAALIGAKLIGPRIGKYEGDKVKAIPGHSITLGALGVFILWFGWFGFNGGSTLSMEGESIYKAGLVFMNTNLSAGFAVITTVIFTWVKFKKPDISMTLNGALAGLVAITAGCDTVSPFGAMIIGITAALINIKVIEFIDIKLKVDDPVGAIGVHGACGAFGTLMVGLLSTQSGLFYGGGVASFLVQLLGVVCISLWVVVIMYPVFKITDRVLGLRVSRREELEGLDTNEHGLKNAYADFMTPLSFDNMNAAPLDGVSLVGSKKMDVPVSEIIGIKPALSGMNEDIGRLTKVDILMKQSKFDELKEALSNIGVTGMTITYVYGCGMQKGAVDFYRGIEVEVELLPKIRVEIIVAEVPVELVVKTAREVLYSGHIGDGKIFVYDVRDVVKVRTGETGYDAMQGLDQL